MVWIAIEPRSAATIPCAGERRSARRDGECLVASGSRRLARAAHSGKSPGPTGSQTTPAAVYSKLLAQLGFRRILRLCFRRACEGWRRARCNRRQTVRRAAPRQMMLLQRTATGLSVNRQSREENNTSDAARTSRAADAGVRSHRRGACCARAGRASARESSASRLCGIASGGGGCASPLLRCSGGFAA